MEGKVFLPTTIKSHMVKIVITWSISPDENNSILKGSIDISPNYQLASSSIAPGCFTPNKFQGLDLLPQHPCCFTPNIIVFSPQFPSHPGPDDVGPFTHSVNTQVQFLNIPIVILIYTFW